MVFVEIIGVVLFILVVYFWFKNREWKIKFEQRIKEWREKEEKQIRKDAILRSARTLSGKTLEKLIPFLEKFPFDPHDVRWLGDPIDLIIFDGKSDKKLDQIVFCEVKSGNSRLTKVQNRIKDLIKNKKIRWIEFRI